MDELKEGLKALGSLDLISKSKEVCRVLFFACHGQLLNPDILKGMMVEIESSNFGQEQSHKWFLDYLGQNEAVIVIFLETAVADHFCSFGQVGLLS